ncbi:ENTH/VHS family protein [Abeliophyllum distichum]|uniref:ENTH/VHS family protein n=1 Tax=Abeliophyllum distichum TaxID=126358 RepID=A0ABD1PQE1_9LAMI
MFLSLHTHIGCHKNTALRECSSGRFCVLSKQLLKEFKWVDKWFLILHKDLLFGYRVLTSLVALLDIHSRMGDDTFAEKLLTEKLSKLNSSQQSIESLSRWCISHRKKAKQVVETWEKLFKSAQREQQISFLYLANDILQNSRRKGSEFVNEFWKILPAALKSVYELGHENCKKVASRLVDIWEERKVFGSRGQNLKNEILGNTPPVTVSNGKNSNPIKVVKRDGNSLRIKLAVGGMPEKILTAFQLVHDEDVNEEAALNQCRTAVSRVQEMEKDVENVSSQGNLQGSDFADKILEQENTLQQCVRQLENAEAIRVALVSQLKEALEDQESKLALIQSELHVAQVLIEQAANVRQQLAPGFLVPTTTNQFMEVNAPRMVEPKFTATQSTNNPSAPPPTHPLTPFSTSSLSEEESKKATVAAVAAKLAASTSSAQMLTSVLSSLVAEEAASMSSGLKSAGFSSLPILPPEKRQKLENSTFSDVDNPEAGNSAYFSATQQVMANMPPNSMKSVSQTNRMQAPFLPPPPPLPPLAPPSNSPASQLVQSAMVGPPYGYGAGNLLLPSLSPSISMGLARPGPPQQAQPQQLQNQQAQQQQQQQQQPPNAGYYRPPGIGFYGQSHQPSTPPVPRQ